MLPTINGEPCANDDDEYPPLALHNVYHARAQTVGMLGCWDARQSWLVTDPFGAPVPVRGLPWPQRLPWLPRSELKCIRTFVPSVCEHNAIHVDTVPRPCAHAFFLDYDCSGPFSISFHYFDLEWGKRVYC